ncbi:MAG: hypothetical protein MK169_03990 [Candidatus Thalassarchaeum sp.]|nr:hypothetical protein [Candidatus Thalassarchaeum sp.]MEC8938258.1 hypothetical protein [Candidatus Thermoplasmatota archaeon]MEC8955094.1 hypothetical protein [Candidatus Thermoplasmatota archaeon]MEC9351400.1 hypothetical protein [Candidatus Thermoplasmatota archaeon]MEC9477793.1 hypothetical protein [Candidatus Thermoplasmatota archaeon]
MDENAKIPGADAPVEERLLFLQENMVNFVKQYSLPVIEVSLVVSKYIRLLLESLEKAALESGEIIPENIAQPWEIESELSASTIDSFPLDKLLGTLDEERMDILDTMLRVIINGAEIPFSSTLTLLRDWEMRLRVQIANATSPGHLFSPMELPDGF